MDDRQWTARCSARLHAQWPRIDCETLDELAADLLRDAQWRAMDPEEAAEEWLRQGIPGEAVEARSTSSIR